MNIFKKLFGGGGDSSADKSGLYFYVQPKGCKEVVRVRIDRNNDLSQSDEGGYFVRKSVRGVDYKCNRTAELELTFDDQRRLQQSDVSGGALVTEADYQAWLASQAPNV